MGEIVEERRALPELPDPWVLVARVEALEGRLAKDKSLWRSFWDAVEACL